MFLPTQENAMTSKLMLSVVLLSLSFTSGANTTQFSSISVEAPVENNLSDEEIESSIAALTMSIAIVEKRAEGVVSKGKNLKPETFVELTETVNDIYRIEEALTGLQRRLIPCMEQISGSDTPLPNSPYSFERSASPFRQDLIDRNNSEASEELAECVIKLNSLMKKLNLVRLNIPTLST